MKRTNIAIASFLGGMAFMYISDPDRGKRRRALARDRAAERWHAFTALLDKAQRDAANRAQGAGCAFRNLFASHRADSPVLLQRVRSRVGRAVSHPHAIGVEMDHNTAVVTGPVLSHEAEHLMRAVESTPGVERVVNKLELHDDASGVSSLQGGQPRTGRPEWMQEYWTPSLRIAAGAAGAAFLIDSVAAHSGIRRLACGAMGTALLTRSICNRQFSNLIGTSGGAHTIEFDKTVHIQAPVEDVFAVWSDYREFPRFMSHLKEVQDVGNGRSHWVAQGPAGIPVSWDAEITESTPNKTIAWRSIPGSAVETEGTVRFDRDPDGGTRITIRMCYRPPAGVLGHYVAALFGTDPKRELHDDMVRLKSLIEHGTTRAHGTRVRREDLTLSPAQS